MYTVSWEDIAADCSSWRCLLHKLLKEGEEKVTNEAQKGPGEKRKQQLTQPQLLTSAPHVARTAIPALVSEAIGGIV